jgi:superoxide dismutase, Cu-Zn family
MATTNFHGPKVYGSVDFYQKPESVLVEVNLWGLPPNKTLGFHIHEYGDSSNGCISLGGHWNPYNQFHGSIFINETKRHAGDLINNITTDKYGKFKIHYFDNLLKVKDIIGRSVVIHDGEDDLGLGGNLESLKTGNAGSRMACAIIGIKNPDIR